MKIFYWGVCPAPRTSRGLQICVEIRQTQNCKIVCTRVVKDDVCDEFEITRRVIQVASDKTNVYKHVMVN